MEEAVLAGTFSTTKATLWHPCSRALRKPRLTSIPVKRAYQAQENLCPKSESLQESLKKKKPNPNTYLVSGLQVKRKLEKTKKSPASAEGALPVGRPKSGTVRPLNMRMQ